MIIVVFVDCLLFLGLCEAMCELKRISSELDYFKNKYNVLAREMEYYRERINRL